MRELMLAIHRLVPSARIGVIVFGGGGEQIQIQPLTTSTGAFAFPGPHPGAKRPRMAGRTLGAVRSAVDNMGWRWYAKKVIVLVGDTPPFKEDLIEPPADPPLPRLKRNFNTIDLTIEVT